MATYLLDTNIIIDALNQKRDRSRFLLDLTEQQGHTLACCPINVAEVYARVRRNEESRTRAFVRSLILYPITFEVAELGGRLKHDHARQGISLSLADTLIAAVAIRNCLTLITDNVKDFPMRELSLYPAPQP